MRAQLKPLGIVATLSLYPAVTLPVLSYPAIDSHTKLVKFLKIFGAIILNTDSWRSLMVVKSHLKVTIQSD